MSEKEICVMKVKIDILHLYVTGNPCLDYKKVDAEIINYDITSKGL